MFKINDVEKVLSVIDADGAETVLYHFIKPEDLKDTKYTLYAYVKLINNKLKVKFGEAKKQSIYDRNDSTGLDANFHTISIWESTKGDKEIHGKLKVRALNNRGYKPLTKEESGFNTEEAYEVESEQGLKNLLNDITEYAETSTGVIKYTRPDYQDVITLCNYIISLYKQGRYKYILDLCTRYGKTGTFCLLFKLLNKLGVRIHLLASYVGTVKASYSEDINTLKNNENCLFVDPDTYESADTLVKEIRAWLKDPKHYICYYVALTGDDACFARRVAALDSFKKLEKGLTIEEADFGSTCDRQVKKIRDLAINKRNGFLKTNFKCIFATTGTNADKCERLLPNATYIKKDYLLDVLKRANAVGIDWYCLNNSEMVKSFNYTCAEMENFSDMFTVENGHLRGELWFRDVIDFLFNKTLPVINKDTRKYRNHTLLNDSATIIFTPVGKEAQHIFKSLVESIVNSQYVVRVINSDVTSNAVVESEIRQLIKDHGHKVILIASGMANRSFSIPEIKNDILMCNTGLPDQKAARCLTPWKEHPEMRGHIIDFRLSYEQSNLSSYLSNMAVDSLEETSTHTTIQQLLDEIRASDKLAFFEYFSAGADPIRQLSEAELRQQMHSRDYLTARAIKVINIDLNAIDLPDIRFDALNEKLNFNGLTNTNIKGDSDKKTQVNRALRRATGKSKKELEQDQRINYLAYLLNHKDEFNSGKYENNILENEFKHNMSAARIAAIENMLGIDMTTMSQIAELLIKNGILIYN